MKHLKFFLMLMVASGLLFTACDNGEDNPTPNPNPNDTVPNDTVPSDSIPDDQGPIDNVRIMMHYKYDDQAFDANQTYQLTDASNTTYNIDFTNVGFIVSDLSVVFDDGNEQLLENSYQVFDAHENTMQTLSFGQYDLGDKTVAGLKFYIGLNPTLNGVDPVVAYNDGDVLYRPDMHWGWNPSAGYKFIKVEGDFAQTTTPDSTRNFVYHIAKNENFQAVSAISNVAPMEAENGDLTWHLDFDVKKILDGIDLSSETSSHSSASTQVITDKVRNNTAAAFSAHTHD